MIRSIFLIWLLFGLPAAALAEVRIIELQHRSAPELVEKVRAVLDPDEKVTEAGHHLLLVAEGESLVAAEKLIGVLDRPLATLIVHLRQAENFQLLSQGQAGELAYSNRQQLAGRGENHWRLGNSSQQTEQRLRVLEGEQGFLEVGRDIPYTEEWAVFTGENTGYTERINYKTIAVGFWVQPVRLFPEAVLVDIEPRLSRQEGDPGAPPEVRFSNARTRIKLPLGQWQPLAETVRESGEVGQAILRWRSHAGQRNETLFLRIDVVEGFSP